MLRRRGIDNPGVLFGHRHAAARVLHPLRVNRRGFGAASFFQEDGLHHVEALDPVTRRSEFDRLKDPAKETSWGKFRQRLEG